MLGLKKILIFFVILLDLHYLCIMNEKNLYINILESMCNTLIFNVLPPPIRHNRYRLTFYSQFLSAATTTDPLLLLAPAFSGRAFHALNSSSSLC